MISTASIAYNFISLIGTIFIGLICIFMLSMLLPLIIRKHDVVLILVANNYLALLAFALTAIPINIDTVRGDYNWYIAEETLSCRIKAYILYSFITIIFNTFTLQAAFRLFRVVYPAYIWLQYGLTYVMIIAILWIISFLSLLPVHFWHDIQLMPTESICVLTIDGARGFIWCTLVIYGLPVITTCIIYLQLTRFMRQSSMNVSVRAKRDAIVVHRIVLVVGILMLIGAPSVVLKLILPFTGLGKSFFYRMSNMTIVIAMIARICQSSSQRNVHVD
ncbi:unnamed protein product [Rotaria sp. Silwood2]|nr:unnamed protein product [Rotaria sp. Silwood2]CAF4074528.1 unnamed protein product [Rotaria sp. Silwood2]